jgi:hypothetical protein
MNFGGQQADHQDDSAWQESNHKYYEDLDDHLSLPKAIKPLTAALSPSLASCFGTGAPRSLWIVAMRLRLF